MTDPRQLDLTASGTKPPSVRSELMLATQRVEILRQVCQALVLEELPAKRARLLSMLALMTHDHDGASDDA